MKRKTLAINRTGRPSLMAEMAKFFSRPWTLEEALVFLRGAGNLLEENERLLTLIKKSHGSDGSNRDLEPTQKTPTNDSTTTGPTTVKGNR